MDTQIKNYWSLYLDFLKDFEALTYNGYSIPYLFGHFYSFVSNNKTLWNALADKKFSKHLKIHVNDRKEVQDVFNQFTSKHRGSLKQKHKSGAVVFHQDKLLRISPLAIRRNFSNSNTMILQAGTNKSKHSNKKKKQGKSRVISAPPAGKTKAPVQTVPNKVFHHKFPIRFLSNYKTATPESIAKVQNDARKIFHAHKNHPLYQDENFQTHFLRTIPEIINRLEQSRQFFNTHSVSCVVVSTTHGYISRILALVASSKGIPTICMQHGIIASEFGYLPKLATVDAVYGKFEVDWYKKIGAPKKSIEIIGHPRFDQAFERLTVNRLKFERRLGLNSNRPTLMIVCRGEQDIKLWRTFIETIKGMKINIIIKNYPSKTAHPLTKEYAFVHSTEGYSIYDIFPHVEAVVAYPSTVGLEAMLAKKPVFILNNQVKGYTDYYLSLDRLIHSDPKVLGKLIRKHFSDPSFRNYARARQRRFLKYAYPVVTSSSERLKQLVTKLTR
ncbi:hypothetical protein [Halalkalibacillus halophilus]|uniref:hypothetical protein n=1 Tax=Halalkalibacillus halophilus TaxID=392827 RepID=UPI0004119F71|nr:hypothetical protein [Halalkalibacillus halophilus]